MKSFVLTRALVALAGIGTTLGVSLTVSAVGGGTAVRVLDWAGPNYAQDVRGFHPVARSLLTELAAKPGRAVAAPARAPAVHQAAPGNDPGVSPGEPSPAPSTSPPPSPPPPAPDPAPALAIAITADTQTTHPNDVFAYTIRVTNSGPGSAKDLVVESHVPDGTTLSGWECDGVRISAKGRDSFACGSSASAGHGVVFGVPSLAPGADVTFRFWVKVDKGLQHNTGITNHAHAHADNADLIDSDQVTVVV